MEKSECSGAERKIREKGWKEEELEDSYGAGRREDGRDGKRKSKRIDCYYAGRK